MQEAHLDSESARLLRRWEVLLRPVDLFVSPALRAEQGEALLRARVSALICLNGSASTLVAVWATTEQASSSVRMATYGLSMSFLVVLVASRFGLSRAIGRHAAIGLLWVYATMLAAVTGGKDSGAAFVALLVPFYGILASGFRAGFFWSVMLAVSLLAVQIALALGFEPPVHPDFDAVGKWNLWAAIIGMFTMLGLAAAYDWLRADAERRLLSEKQRADRLHAEQRENDRRFQSELKALIDARTAELEASNRELLRAERLASIGTLAAGVAHEINNPVGAILISTQFALQNEAAEDRDDVWRAALAESEAQALRCARIVKGLLRFAAGSATMKSPQDLNEIVRAALLAMRGAVSREQYDRIETVLEPGSLPVLADPVALEQVVVNLVRNALEATPNAKVAVRIETTGAGAGACLSIDDDGPGIADEDLPRIFDPFFSTRERAGGTGLGLSIVHGIVREHGGTIDVESRLGEGTRFRVRLPVAPAESAFVPAISA